MFHLTNEKSEKNRVVTSRALKKKKRKKRKGRRELCKVSGSHMLCGRRHSLNTFIVTLIVAGFACNERMCFF